MSETLAVQRYPRCSYCREEGHKIPDCPRLQTMSPERRKMIPIRIIRRSTPVVNRDGVDPVVSVSWAIEMIGRAMNELKVDQSAEDRARRFDQFLSHAERSIRMARRRLIELRELR